MDGLLFIFGLLAVAWVLATPILVILHTKLKSRVGRLNDRIALLESKLQDAVVSEPKQGAPILTAKAQTAQVTQDIVTPDTPEPETTLEPEIEIAASSMPVVAKASSEDAVPDAPPKAFVFRQETMDAFSTWLKENWVLAAGAASLSLAGVFLVQYGAERGYLTPFWRVMAAIVFGSILLAGGEIIRRRFGGDTSGATQFLPSALSGAGLITLFAAVLSARMLYDLITPGQAFVGLAAVSAIGVVFGWFYGPVLTVVGILGATSAPYLIGGSSDSVWVLQYYFALIALAALAIDTLKRWAWVSVLGLLATFGSIWFIFLASNEPVHFVIATLIVAAGAIIIPQRRLVPDHTGSPVAGLIWKALPEFPTRLSFGVTANTSAAALAVAVLGSNVADAYLGLLVMVVVMVATTLWLWRTPALSDHALLPLLSFLGLIATQPLLNGAMFQSFANAAARGPETAPPAIVWHLLVVAAIGTVLIFWRMPRTSLPLLWGLAASSLAPFAVFLLEFLWNPSEIYGSAQWSLAVIAVAALMTLLAERAMRLDLPEKALITSLFAVAAISLIGLSLFLVLTKTALTLGLAIMILLVTLLDRRFDLPLLVYYGIVGAAVITYRLVIDPGLDWAVRFSTSLPQVLLAFVGTMAILAGAWIVARSFRPRLTIVLESTLWVLSAAFVFVLFDRLLPGRGVETHWGLGLLAALWTTMALAQFYRMQGASRFERVLRKVLAGGLTLIVIVILAVRFAFINPFQGDAVIGAPFFSSLALAYLPMGIVLALASWKLPNLRPYPRAALGIGGAFYALAYVALSIRHFWRGPDLSLTGFTDPELYSYTLAMLLASAGMLIVAFWKRAVWLRKLAMASIALTIAKVFFVDMAGLSGLLRVVSFMGLGLALLALTWLDRVMSAQWDKSNTKETDVVLDD
ncbi:MAG: DUF2339 domain-containing protein [Paracoccaceae bacterium]